MRVQDLALELTAPSAQELLNSAAIARLAYGGGDGFPMVIPVGFYWDGAHVIVCTAPISFRWPLSRPGLRSR